MNKMSWTIMLIIIVRTICCTFLIAFILHLLLKFFAKERTEDRQKAQLDKVMDAIRCSHDHESSGTTGSSTGSES